MNGHISTVGLMTEAKVRSGTTAGSIRSCLRRGMGWNVTLFALLWLICSVAFAHAPEDSVCETLLADEATHAIATVDPWDMRALDLAEICLLRWSRIVREKPLGNIEAKRAAYALSLTGGREATQALLLRYRKQPSSDLKAYVAFAMGSTGSKADVEWLTKALKGDVRTHGIAIEQSANTLGLLRATSSRTTLEELRVRGQGTLLEEAAEFALTSLGRPQCIAQSNEPFDQAARALVLACGVQDLQESARFLDGVSGRAWVLENGKWEETIEANAGVMPIVRFSSAITMSRRRGIIDVAIYFGPLSGYGYQYFLERQGGAWRVYGVRNTWIS